MATDYGSDVTTFPDLDPTFAPISGRRVVAEAIARRLSTPRGSLVAAPNYGIDLRGYLNASIRDRDPARLAADIETECEKDERVLSATALVTFDAPSMTLTVRISLELADGPFALVLAVSGVSLKIVTAG